jgi:hypothetical protein
MICRVWENPDDASGVFRALMTCEENINVARANLWRTTNTGELLSAKNAVGRKKQLLTTSMFSLAVVPASGRS